ncbi:hypothetical protein Tco_0917431 [Tanacetum coccineum]
MPHDSPLSGGDTPRSDEGSKKLNELIELCTKLFDKVISLEKDLKQTKQVYGKALTKLVNKVKHLEDQLKSTTKRRKAKVVISHEEEDLTFKSYTRRRSTDSLPTEDMEKALWVELKRLFEPDKDDVLWKLQRYIYWDHQNSDAPLIEEWVSNNEDEVESHVVVEKKTVVPTIPKVDVVRPKQQEKSVRKTVRYAEMYRSKGPRGNQRNWNNLKSQQLGSNFVMYNKACYVCGSFDHLQYTCKQKRQLNGQREEKPVWNNARRVNHQNSPRITHPNPKRHMVPRKILTRSGPISLNTARQSHFNVVRTNWVNVVKASACWVWRPIKPNSASITLKRYDYVDGNPEIELEDSVRLNSPETKRLHGKLMLIENITSEVNAD